MTRSPGLIASAIVSIAGSLLFLLIAAVTVFYVPPQRPGVPDMRSVSLVTGALLGGLSILGIATGVGVLRLRAWARTSILVFAGIMGVSSLIAGIAMAFVPLPSTPNVGASTLNAMRPMMVGLYVVPFLIGVWWLIQFNTQRTRAAFAGDTIEGLGSGRPLGVSVLGWWFLVSGVGCLVPLALRMPVLLGGSIWTGGSATALYVIFASLSCYLGAGLLRLEQRARVQTIAFMVLGCVNVLVMFLRPGASERMAEYQKLVSFGGSAQPVPDMSGFYPWMAVFSVAISAGVIAYLVRRRSAFEVAV